MLSNGLATGSERDDYGATPVHDAAEHGQIECLHAFYNHGVSLIVQDANGFTPGLVEDTSLFLLYNLSMTMT